MVDKFSNLLQKSPNHNNQLPYNHSRHHKNLRNNHNTNICTTTIESSLDNLCSSLYNTPFSGGGHVQPFHGDVTFHGGETFHGDDSLTAVAEENGGNGGNGALRIHVFSTKARLWNPCPSYGIYATWGILEMKVRP